MASRYSAPATCREHVTPVRQAKGAKPDLKNDPQPVSATTRTRLHLPSGKLTIRKVQNQRGQIEFIDLARPSVPKSKLRKTQKNTLIHSDTTDPFDLLLG